MTEHIILTGAAVTRIIWESGEKENCLIFYSFLFVGSILIKYINFVRYGLLALKNEILAGVYQKQGIQNVELDPGRGLSHALCKLWLHFLSGDIIRS